MPKMLKGVDQLRPYKESLIVCMLNDANFYIIPLFLHLFDFVASVAKQLEDAVGTDQMSCSEDKHRGHFAHGCLYLGQPFLVALSENGWLLLNLF